VKKVEWSPIDYSVIFTASADGSLAILDSRFPNDHILHQAAAGEEI
jgi:WD40 repeat protein